jgi:hypothetical protein
MLIRSRKDPARSLQGHPIAFGGFSYLVCERRAQELRRGRSDSLFRPSKKTGRHFRICLYKSQGDSPMTARDINEA